MTSTSQPNLRSFFGPESPSCELGVLVSNELREEITTIPIRYGTSQVAAPHSMDGLWSGGDVAAEIASSTNPMRIATSSFQTTVQPEHRMHALGTMNGDG